MMNLLIATAAASAGSPWMGFLGKLHPGIVHFPIALLSVAAFFEVLQILRKRREPMPGTLPLVWIAALNAVLASLFGWFLQEYESTEGAAMSYHKWLGFASTGVAVAAALLAFKVKNSAAALLALRIALILGAALVLVTGYLGGELVFGENHIFSVFRKKDASKHLPDDKPLLIPAAGKVDFVNDIAPIIKNDCFKCHGGEKVKGKLKLNTKALAMEGGESGKAILPGKPSISKFYTSLLDPDEDVLMPPPKEKARPTKEQIEKVRKWIEEGADWPDGFEFKK
jgi:uncharacterized membrane protein